MLDKTAEDKKRDGDATAKQQADVQPKPQQADSYKSQSEVDNAFKKRFAALKQKWESEQAEKQKQVATEQQVTQLMARIEDGAEDFFENYPDVDISQIISQDALFAYLVANGKSLSQTYAFLYDDESAKQKQQADMEQAILGNLRARNQRPRALSAANSGVTSKDIARLSDAEILSIDKRIKNGERVTL